MAKQLQSTWQQFIAIFISALIAAVFAGWYYYTQYYIEPQKVFWSTLDQSLQTGSITKTLNRKASDSQSVKQVTKLQFKSNLASDTTVIMTDTTKDKSSTVVTQTIGTPTQDYLKYQQIKSDQNQPPKNAIGVWAVNTASKDQPAQILQGELLSDPIIFGYLNKNQRADLIKQMQVNKVFEIDFNATNTLGKLNGRKVYTYKATINLPNYVPVYKSYLQMIGQKDLASQIAPPQDDTTYKVTFSINPLNRQLLQLLPDGATDPETFSMFGSNSQINIPKYAKLSIADLQTRLTGVNQ